MKRNRPLVLWKEEALLRRTMHRTELASSVAMRQSGHRGEQELDYHLSFLPSGFKAFQDLRLLGEGGVFQMDTLIVSPYFAIIIEVKNWSGKLVYNQERGQWIRFDVSGKEERFPNPLGQVQRQKHHLLKWLRPHLPQPLPIETLVTLSNPNCIMDTNSPHLPNVLHTENIISKIKELNSCHRKQILTEAQLHTISQHLHQNRLTDRRNPLSTFHIGKEDILPGVFCPLCQKLHMKWNRRRFRCPFCGHSSANAYLYALYDYFLLFGENVTCKEAQKFLKLDNRHTTYKLLQQTGFRKEGTNKGTKYYQPDNLVDRLEEQYRRQRKRG
ncbi:NERD domain-containing protein [Pontibacillus salicampi]|uniref:NERD domain-containing protein n=1 Tax=Pontibacillus salicampi TaxID=1449801 RepID=A0ABV6LSJ1_9BACI